MPTSATGTARRRGPAPGTGRSAEHGFESEPRSAEHGFTFARRSAEHGFTFARRSAEHGFTFAKRSAEHGFTLVELLVVLTIIGLASAVVVLAMPDPRGSLRTEGERFAARVRAAQEEAIASARPVALAISTEGYGFETRRDGRWRPIDARPFERRSWGGGTQALVGEAGAARAIFDPTGGAEPVRVTLVRGDARVAVTVAADGGIDVAG